MADLGLEYVPLAWESYDIALGGAALGAARPLITALRDPLFTSRSSASVATTSNAPARSNHSAERDGG